MLTAFAGCHALAFIRYALAFEPSKSPHYKVVCVTNFLHYYDGRQHEICIYSSETRTADWRHLNTPFFSSPSEEGRHYDFRKHALHFDSRRREGAVYCNGVIHWMRARRIDWLLFSSFDYGREEFIREDTDVLHYFHISEERLGVVSAVPHVPLVVKNIPLEDNPFCWRFPYTWPIWTQRYLEDFSGRLCLIETYKHCMTQFDVMEMKMDYSGWLVKYHVDLNLLVAALPGQDWNHLVVLCLSQADQEIDNYYGVEDFSTNLLLHLPGKVISYNLRNNAFKFVELTNKEPFLALGDNHPIPEHVAFPYMETLACL